MSNKHDEDCMCEDERPAKAEKKESVLKKSIYDKSLKSPAEVAKAAKGITEPKSIVSKCPNIQPFKLEDMEVDKVLVEYRIKGQPIKSSNIPIIVSKKPLSAPKKLEPCDALKLAGFQADWTREKVAKMLQTPDGAALLKKVDIEYRQLTGKAALSEKDIIACYPNYTKKERRNLELLVELDSDEHILSVTEKSKVAKNNKSKFNLV